MNCKRIKTYFDGEGAVAKKHKRLSKEEWNQLLEKFPEGPPTKRRYYDGRPQRSLNVYFIRRSTTEMQLRSLFSNFGAVMNVFVEPQNNSAYIVFANTLEATAAKKALDGQMYYDGEEIQFILRRVDVWKEGDRRRMNISLRNAYGKLSVDYSPVPDSYQSILSPVPAWRRSVKHHDGRRQDRKKLNDPRHDQERASLASWMSHISKNDEARTQGAEATTTNETPDDFYDDSEEILGEWATKDTPTLQNHTTQHSDADHAYTDDFYDDSPAVIGEWAAVSGQIDANESS